jgi:hypothetical protein
MPTRMFLFEKTPRYLKIRNKKDTNVATNNPIYAALLCVIMIKNMDSIPTRTEKYFQNPLFIEYPVKTSGRDMSKKPE